MKVNRFEEFIAWQKDKLLAVAVYQVFKSSSEIKEKELVLRLINVIFVEYFEGGELSNETNFIFFSQDFFNANLFRSFLS